MVSSFLQFCKICFIFSLILNCSPNGFNKNDYQCTKIPNLDYSKMVCILKGEFLMGYNNYTKEEDTNKKVLDTYPEHKVFLDSFWIDQYEVTFSEYQKCVEEKGCSPAKPNYIGFSNPNQPMVGVNWYQARDFCKWKQKRLPTEAEWEKAARGERGEIYPWGNEPATCQKAIIKEKDKTGCGKETTWDVGSKGAFRYGLYDLAGNSWEWVLDWYSESYEKCGLDCFKKNPKGPCEGLEPCPGFTKKVVRGGSWFWEGEYATGYNRRSHYPNNKPFHHFGFRCARDG
ncbi:MAG: formylglycine-generating enzyme family protein [Leptonema sp. (in: bacteria)]